MEGGALDGETRSSTRTRTTACAWRSGRLGGHERVDLRPGRCLEEWVQPIRRSCPDLRAGPDHRRQPLPDGRSPDDTLAIDSNSRYSIIQDGDTSNAITNDDTSAHPLRRELLRLQRQERESTQLSELGQLPAFETKNRDGSAAVIGDNEFSVEFFIRSGWKSETQLSHGTPPGGTFLRVLAPLDDFQGDGGLQIVQLTTDSTTDSPNIDNKTGALCLRVTGNSKDHPAPMSFRPVLPSIWTGSGTTSSSSTKARASTPASWTASLRSGVTTARTTSSSTGGLILGTRADKNEDTYFDGDLAHVRILNGTALNKGSNEINVPGTNQNYTEVTGGWVSQRPEVPGPDAVPLLNAVFEPGKDDPIRDDLIFDFTGAGLRGEYELTAAVLDKEFGRFPCTSGAVWR